MWCIAVQTDTAAFHTTCTSSVRVIILIQAAAAWGVACVLLDAYLL